MKVWKTLYIVGFLLIGSPKLLYAETLSTQAWGRIAADFEYRHSKENDPTSTGSTQESFEDSMESTPEIALGLDLKTFERFKISSFLDYQHRYFGSENTRSPLPFSKDKDFPDTLAMRILTLHLGFETLFKSPWSLGLSMERQWGQSAWQEELWAHFTHLKIYPWIGFRWNDRQRSFLLTLIEQNLHNGDEEKTFKIQSSPMKTPNLRLSHIYQAFASLQVGFAGSYQHLIFEDFWYDQTEKELSFGANWSVLPGLSLASLVRSVQREYSHPWKRHGPCGRERGARGFDFYWHDALDCSRLERETGVSLALSWEIFREFRLEALARLVHQDSHEREYAVLRRSFLFSISWQTQETVFSDPLRNFLPWAYQGHPFH